MLDEQLVDVFSQWPHHQTHHHLLEDRVDVEELVRPQLQPHLLHLALKLGLAVHQVVLHARHELPHVARHHVRTGFLAFLRALDEVVDILRERRRLVGSQSQGVSPDGRPGATCVAIPQGLQARWSCGRENFIRAFCCTPREWND